MQLRSWSEIYKHYSTWISISIVIFNVLVYVFGTINAPWVVPINAALGALVLIAKKIKQGMEDVNVILEEKK